MLGKTAGELYDYCCLHYGDQTALITGQEVCAFSELKDKGTRLANALSNLGAQKGERLAILMPNCPEVLFADYACAKLGLVRVPLAAYLQPPDMAFVMRDTGAKTLVYDEAFRPQVEKIRSELPLLETLVCSSREQASVAPGEHHLQTLVATGSCRALAPVVSEDDLYLIAYTGGTTGVPKGVVHSHRTFVASVAMELLDFGIGRNEVFLATTPLTHASGALVLPVFLRGGCCVVLQGFEPGKFLETVERERVTSSFVVPTMIYALLDYPSRNRFDATSLRNVLYGAAPIASERLREAVRVFGPVFTQLYGQAEAPMALTCLPKEEHTAGVDGLAAARLASCGKPTLATKLRLVGDDGRDVPPGEPGEIVVRTPNVMIGYWNRPDLTAQTLRDGWLHTGDVARQDAEGYLYIVDRKKDMIVSGGFNVFPKEIEDCLHEHPAVAMAAVIGVPDAKWGESVKAVVVTKPGKSATQEDLIRFCKECKGSVMAPKSVDFLDAIPLTPLGKPDKKAIRNRYWAGAKRRVG